MIQENFCTQLIINYAKNTKNESKNIAKIINITIYSKKRFWGFHLLRTQRTKMKFAK